MVPGFVIVLAATLVVGGVLADTDEEACQAAKFTCYSSFQYIEALQNESYLLTNDDSLLKDIARKLEVFIDCLNGTRCVSPENLNTLADAKYAVEYINENAKVMLENSQCVNSEVMRKHMNECKVLGVRATDSPHDEFCTAARAAVSCLGRQLPCGGAELGEVLANNYRIATKSMLHHAHGCTVPEFQRTGATQPPPIVTAGATSLNKLPALIVTTVLFTVVLLFAA